MDGWDPSLNDPDWWVMDERAGLDGWAMSGILKVFCGNENVEATPSLNND
jgi:hypothetical protein